MSAGSELESNKSKHVLEDSLGQGLVLRHDLFFGSSRFLFSPQCPEKKHGNPLQNYACLLAVDFHAWQNLAVSRSQLDVPAGPETESDKSKHALEDSLRASFEA